jgi:hypothetical protein
MPKGRKHLPSDKATEAQDSLLAKVISLTPLFNVLKLERIITPPDYIIFFNAIIPRDGLPR